MTQNDYIFQQAKRIFEEELKKCYDLLKENEEKWNEYMDLKLHEASFCDISFEENGATVTFSPETQEQYFRDFCDTEYDAMLECLMDGFGIDFHELKDDVGRASKFYLGKLHNNEKDKYLVALAEAVEDIYYTPIDIKETEDGIVTDFSSFDADHDFIEEVDEMLSLCGCVYKELDRVMDDIKATYDYIHNFKKNQVETFKEFCKDGWIQSLY